MANIGKYFKIVIGLLVTALGLNACIYFWPNLWDLMKGAVGPVVVLIGLLILAVAALD